MHDLRCRPTPSCAPRYCGTHNPSCVVKCLGTGKWFCNGRTTKAGSCIIVHLVKSKNKARGPPRGRFAHGASWLSGAVAFVSIQWAPQEVRRWLFEDLLLIPSSLPTSRPQEVHLHNSGPCTPLPSLNAPPLPGCRGAPAQEVQLHKDSPLGDAVLECYASGSRNLFVLGFVPVKSENTVVLLARDITANHPAIKELNLDLSQWMPIVEVRCGLEHLATALPSLPRCMAHPCVAGASSATHRSQQRAAALPSRPQPATHTAYLPRCAPCACKLDMPCAARARLIKAPRERHVPSGCLLERPVARRRHSARQGRLWRP